MNLTLRRSSYVPEGVFGALYDDHENIISYTLEHSYGCRPKVCPGAYKCVRHGPSRLPYETFMLCGVPDFNGQKVDGILIHRGNSNQDSEGCILLGSSIEGIVLAKSKIAFDSFMDIQKDVSEFTLTIV